MFILLRLKQKVVLHVFTTFYQSAQHRISEVNLCKWWKYPFL